MIDSVHKLDEDIKIKIHDYNYMQKLYNEKDTFIKETIFSLIKEEKMQNVLTYVCYAYIKNAEKYFGKFKIHFNQMLTALEACESSLFKKRRTSKGIIYQVETGEGKSCIVQIIASVLALMKKTVHITSSNINLSNRYYYNSYEFFNLLGLTSAVLLHYNELPYVNFNNSIYNNVSYSKSKFPKKFFGKKLFKNTSNMNFSVCGINTYNELTKDKANIVFSTFINFECLYLRMMEMCPSYIPKYFGSCSLIIDEADSVLIDELTNGTILSRPIKTNANEILEYVYDSKMKNIPLQTVYSNINKKWPECVDLKLDDINSMYKEIELVNRKEFANGKKYSIEEFELKEKTSLIDNLRKSFEDSKQNKERCKKQVFRFFSKKSKNKKANDSKYDEVTTKKVTNRDNFKKVKMIIPFDYDHKGILEPNKEFSGFIQQFIGIKEKRKDEENSNIVIKDITMNYLYVSHPIFVNLYDSVVGLTGTIGNKYDKKIYKEQYHLETMKIPRNNPNLRVELPVLLCDDIDEGNKKIVIEVLHQYRPYLYDFLRLQNVKVKFSILH